MITRAIINKIDYESSKIRVRIPIFDGIANDPHSTADEDLSWATILCLPGFNIDYEIGDIVIVAFEDDDNGKPIIIGYLKLDNSKNDDYKVRANLKSANIEENLNTSTQVNLGKLTYKQIFDKVNQ